MWTRDPRIRPYQIIYISPNSQVEFNETLRIENLSKMIKETQKNKRHTEFQQMKLQIKSTQR